MNSQLQDVIQEALRVALLVLIPTLVVPALALGSSLLQGMMGIREDGLQYAVRMLALAGVVLMFGPAAFAALCELLMHALR